MTKVMPWSRWAAVWSADAIQYGFAVNNGSVPPNGYFLTRGAAVRHAGKYFNKANRYGGTRGHWQILRKGEV